MLSVLLGSAFVSRQFWGWLTDRIGGLYTIVLASSCQAAALLAFVFTQDEAGLFMVSAAFGLGFSGIIPARQPGVGGQVGPGDAAVDRLVETAAGTAAGQFVWPAPRLPERDVDVARVGRVERDIVGAGVLALGEDEVPARPAVARPVEPALGVRPVGVAEGGDVDEIGVSADGRGPCRCCGSSPVRDGASCGRRRSTCRRRRHERRCRGSSSRPSRRRRRSDRRRRRRWRRPRRA